MSPTDPHAAPPWALLDAGTIPTPASWLGQRFGGVVTLDAPAPAPASGALSALRRGLGGVPQDVTTVVFLRQPVEDTTDALVGELLARLEDGDDAVAAGVPVTDALKRVDGERVVGSVDRRDLFSLGAPQVLRRHALAAVMKAAQTVQTTNTDPATQAAQATLAAPATPAAPAGPPDPAATQPATSAEADPADPATMMLAAGRRVRLVPVGGGGSR